MRQRNRSVATGVGGDMPNSRLPVAVVFLALMAAACGSGTAASPSSSPGPTPTPEPSGVDHPNGPTDIVLRMEEGGGFVPIDFLAGQAPTFTLYGDGRIVFQQLQEVFPQPDADGVTRNAAWRTAQLDDGQIEELLTFALGPGGLGAARDSYIDNGIADAPNTIFTVNGGGLKKTVVVNALGMDATGGPDDAARRAFKVLADRLRDFDAGGTISSDVYAPTTYRAVLFEREADPLANPQPKTVAWPWPKLTLADFPTNANGAGGEQFPHRALTPDEVAALGLGEIPGGVSGLILDAPDGKTYSLVLRPLLPDESS